MNKKEYHFNRYIKLIFTLMDGEETYEFELDTSFIDIETKVSLSTNIEKDDHAIYSNKASITIYNLPLKIKNELLENTPVTIPAGYLDLPETQGVIYNGIIENVSESSDGVTSRTQIQCSEANDEFQKLKYIISIKKTQVKASEVLKRISEHSKLEFEIQKLGIDLIYTRARTYNGTLKQIIQSIARDTNSHAFISRRKIFFLDNKEPVLDELICDIEKVKNITETDTGYSIDMIFDHRMEPNYNLSIKYEGNRFKKSLEGIYKIIRVEHDLSALNNSFTSKIELEDSLKSIQTKEKNENYPKEIKIEI